MRLTLLLIFSCVLLQCSKPEPTSIEIVVRDNSFVIDGEAVQEDALEQFLQQKKKVFGDRQPTIVLKVASDTKRGKLADLETILRKLNFREIQYVDLDNSKSS